MTMHHARVAMIEDGPVKGLSRARPRTEALPTLSEAVRGLVASVMFVIGSFGRRERMRNDMLGLTDDQLKDIGVTRDEALRAAERIEWRSDWK
ncbi:DUF1127 domain-containing protein [Jiella marina]|uniref:DUF1127 domain-containing protein n=1 Tax=Jiella sp. LLJ827 TaxID=2917712 RepID=UPI0021008619|nr:DUF1127 domain-containing protein [Jiella sp. LLJ827]MCQ0986634.1 DUF1127 domain-containing protein [Jiella sp. LLJ827]